MKKSNLAVLVVILAAFFYKIIRSLDPGDTISRVFDKISNMFLPGTTQQRIYDAALQRLQTKFDDSQAKILAGLMVAQSCYETAVGGQPYKSNVLQNNLNAFGYKYYPKSIYQIGKGSISPELNAYARYNDVADSAREVADWIGRRKADFNKVKEYEGYALALKKNNYFGQDAQAYAKGVLKFISYGQV